MRTARRAIVLAALAPLAAIAALAAEPAGAAAWRVPPRAGEAARTLERASDGDTLLFAKGVHAGPLTVRRRVVLRGEPGAVIDGGGTGSVVTVLAGGVRIEDLTLRGSGDDVGTLDAGVRLAQSPSTRLTGLRIVDVRYGIAAERSDFLVVDRCALTGRVVAAGNGIHLWYSRGARVRASTVRRFMDGIYLSFADGIEITGSVSERNGRYGLHTMYCQDNRIAGNRFTANIAGCAIMFSNHLRVERNDFTHNRGPRTYGLLLRDCSDGLFRENRLVDNTVAIFMDNSNRNRLHGNLIQDDGWGVILFASCAGNEFARNDFVNADYPVALDMRRTDNRFDDGAAGNYWSANTPYDLDADGIGDVPYHPVSAFAFLSKQYPDLAIFGESPAANALTLAERTIPSLRPSEAVDRFPLARPAGLGAGAPGAFPGTAAAPRGAADPDAAAPGRSAGSSRAALGFLALAGAGALGFLRAARGVRERA
jgi:nitrous oxidase accessory protein